MRTNIVIDDQLVADAMKLSGVKTKREVVELALLAHDYSPWSWLIVRSGLICCGTCKPRKRTFCESCYPGVRLR